METAAHKPDKISLYLAIYALLMALLIATVAASRFDLGQLNIAIAMVIAVIKALLVVLFFMHVRHSSRLTWVFACAAFLWLAILLGLTMTDYLTRAIIPETQRDLVTPAPAQGPVTNRQNIR